MKNTKKSARSGVWAVVFSTLVYLLLGALYGLALIPLLKAAAARLSFGRYLLYLAGTLVVLYAAFFVELILHEAGHLVFGLATGYRFLSFRIGSFLLLRENGRLRMRRYSLPGTAGQCLLAPPDWNGGRLPYALYNLGGVLMNLLTAALFGALSALCAAVPLLSLFFFAAAEGGVAFALLNGVPMRMKMVNNDGRNTLEIRRSAAARRAFWVQMKVMEETTRGVRLREMPEEYFAPLSDETDSGITSAVRVLQENRLMDAHRFPEAEKLADALCAADAGVIGLHRLLLGCDRMTCAALRGDADAVRALETKEQTRFMKQLPHSITVARTAYVTALLCDRDPAAAERHRALFEKAAAAYPYPSEAAAERELMALADEAARRQEAI